MTETPEQTPASDRDEEAQAEREEAAQAGRLKQTEEEEAADGA